MMPDDKIRKLVFNAMSFLAFAVFLFALWVVARETLNQHDNQSIHFTVLAAMAGNVFFSIFILFLVTSQQIKNEAPDVNDNERDKEGVQHDYKSADRPNPSLPNDLPKSDEP